MSVARASGDDERSTRLGVTLSVHNGALVRGLVIAGLLTIVLFVLPTFLGNDWITTLTSVAIYAVAAAGFGILYGRVGMISLGQFALLAVGVWIGTRLAYATSWPFPVLLLATGAITCVIGVLVGLPALRLSGLYLALITLMFAGATEIVLAAIDFPNGGGGFKGRTNGVDVSGSVSVRRPSWAHTDTAYYRYVVVVVAILFLLALVHVAGKSGRAWAAIRASEPAALAAGVNITLYKLWAFALASFMTGVAGCLFTAQIGVPRPGQFTTQQSLILAATAMIGGIFSLWGAVLAGVFAQFLPFLLSSGQLWGWVVNVNILNVIFGIGLIQVLLTAPGGIVQQFPKDMANLGRLIARQTRKLAGQRGGEP